MYGTTEQGGANSEGTLFNITTAGSLSTLYNFNWSDGGDPFGSLCQASDGSLYGTTGGGGANGNGTVFKLTLRALTLNDANIQFTHVDLSDANTGNIGPDQLTSLAAANTTRTGAAADGATKILLNFSAPSAGTVTFKETNSYTGDSLRMVNSLQAPTDVPTTLISGSNVAFAVYTVPDTIPSANPAPVTFEADFTPTGGTQAMPVAASLNLVRPPVVLIHGLWGCPASWSGSGGILDLLSQNGFNCYVADYRDSNTSSLISNQVVPLLNSGGILDAYNDYRSKGNAVTKVDVVAHSMGGLITREFALWSGYMSPQNFGDGFVHRLITVDTPHYGSPLANALQSIATDQDTGRLAQSLMTKIGRPYGEAIVDLQTYNPVLQSLGDTRIPSFAECGIAESQNISQIPWYIPTYDIILFFSGAVIFNESNDLIVGLTSQQGGIFPPYTKTTDANHWQAPASPSDATDVLTLLTGLASSYASGFPAVPPAPSLSYAGTLLKPLNLKPSAAPLFQITSPSHGKVYKPGATVTVTLSAAPGENLTAVLFMEGSGNEPIGSSIVSTAPFTESFTIPTTYAGTLPISVTARDASGNVSTTTVNVTVQTTGTIQSLNLTPPTSTLTSLGDTVQLDVQGLFSDGTTRDVTDSSTGTTYASDDDSIATVTSEGLIAAVANGACNITVTKGSMSSTVPITVQAGVPLIVSVSPTSANSSAAIQLTVLGHDLGATSSVEFLLNGQLDTTVSASNMVIDTHGDTLTATCTISAAALPGVRTVVITTPGGSSDPLAVAGVAGFTVNDGVASVSINPSQVVGSRAAVGTVTLSGPAPVNGEIVDLVSSNPSVASVHASVNVQAGKTSAAFQIITSGVPSTTSVNITASALGTQQTANLTVIFAILHLSFNPASVTGGQTSTGTVMLSAPAPSNLTVKFKSFNTAVVPTPSAITIAAGQTQGTFICNTTSVSASSSVKIQASAAGAGSQTQTLMVDPAS